MGTAYIGLGANTGNREANLRMALGGLTRMARVEAVSSLYETDPVGSEEQLAFYNAVCRIQTGLEPESLLRLLKTLEHEIGRRPGAERWGPRPIWTPARRRALGTEADRSRHPTIRRSHPQGR